MSPSGETLVIERTFRASAERVFDAWTSEEVMRRWFHGEHAWETPVAEVDLRVGGSLRVVMRDPEKGEDYGGGGRYTAIERPTRLAFTWTWDDERRETLIEIEFAEVGPEQTEVRFTHSGLADREAVESHEGGWGNAFDNLDAALAAG